MKDINFKKAISIAQDNAIDLMPHASKFTLEGAIVSGGDYEITLSYYLTGQSPLELDGEGEGKNALYQLATLMGTRRECKVFLVDKNNFAFKGFKAYQER